MNKVIYTKLSVFILLAVISVKTIGQNIDEQNIQVNKIKADEWEAVSISGYNGKKTLIYHYGQQPLNLSEYTHLAVDIENSASCKLIVDIRYKGPWRNHVNQGRCFVPANETQQAKLVLNRMKLQDSSSWMPTFKNERGLPGGYVRHWDAFDLKDVKKVEIGISWENYNGEEVVVRVKKPYGEGVYMFPSLSYKTQPKPMLDEMGQYVGDNWDGKIAAIKELKKLGVQDKMKYIGAKINKEFSKYGGWKNGPQMEAKGHFYTTKYKDKWWLVDPDGYLFWSQGVTGVGNGSGTSILNRSELFPTFENEKETEVWKLLKADVDHQQIDFYSMNLKRKYGNDWQHLHEEVTVGRMKAWGLNTYGAWSNPSTGTHHPYTLIIHPRKQGIGMITKMVDPFSDDFLRDLKKRLTFLEKYKGDPWNLGIFVNNELHWRSEMDIPNEILSLDNTVPARAAFESFLKEKYNDIEQLNIAWGSHFKNFRELNGADAISFSVYFKQDMVAYLEYFADTYYRIVAEEVHRAMPNHLYLGSRLHDKAKYNRPVQRAASRHCDVVSFNMYQFSVQDFEVLFDVDKPCIIGEFHFGTGSHGVWGTGLQSAYSLENQADNYTQYIKEACSHPNFVGAHWFQWSDQPATGRGSDGENFRIGLVNVCDQPYEILVKAIKVNSGQLYDTRYSSK